MKNPVYELKHQRAALLDEAKKALETKDMTTYKAKFDEAQGLNAEIEANEALQNETSRYTPTEKTATLQEVQQAMSDEKENATKIDAARSGSEYARAFAAAINRGVTTKTVRQYDDLKPLYAALTIGGGSPEGSNGGFLVPIDFDDFLREERKQLMSLTSLFATENVTTLTGWRAIDTAPTEGFTKIAEMATIPKDDQPMFRRVNYAVEPYALIVPVSNELIADNTVGLMQYLARWFARKGVITENKVLLALLAELTATDIAAGGEIAALKKALNVDLDPDVSVGASILTNQSGFNVLDNLLDTTKRPILQPDPSNATRKMYGGHPIDVMSDAMLPNDGGKAPLYVGDYRLYGTLFRRQPLEVAATDVGGNAWATNSTETRGIMRLDAQTMESTTVVKLGLTV